MNFGVPLPSKDCPNCDGSGVMGCPECQGKLQIRISADDIMEPPWKAYNIVRKMDYPYEGGFLLFQHIVDSIKDPSIAAFWLITMPKIMGGFDFDDDVKKKIWWQYKESMRYDELRDVVAKHNPGWEYLQEALVSIDPTCAREDPVVVRNIPYYKAKKALEAEVMKLDPPPRPQNWGELNLPLNASSWTKEDLKDPTKMDEMTVLLNAQREIADKMLDAQWEMKWRQEKLNKMLEEKVQPYIQNIDNTVPNYGRSKVNLIPVKGITDLAIRQFLAQVGRGDGGYFDSSVPYAEKKSAHLYRPMLKYSFRLRSSCILLIFAHALGSQFPFSYFWFRQSLAK